MKIKKMSLVIVVLLTFGVLSVTGRMTLEENFVVPPPETRLHSYWWWLNGNVTAEAITRDLEAMKEKGFGGAMITDAGGANHRGNRQVPSGPLFGSEPWRKLYRHALREGKRLDMEMALMIQSGWNLGGPGVTADDAAKILCWSETKVVGSGPVTINLPTPRANKGLLREVAVLAVPDHAAAQFDCKVTASSAHKKYPSVLAADGKNDTWWVSDGSSLPDGALAWIRIDLDHEREVSELVLSGRPRYGPKAFEVFAIGPNGKRRKLPDGQAGVNGVGRMTFDPAVVVQSLEIRVTEGYDSKLVGGRPRNIQIAELRVAGSGWAWPPNASLPLTYLGEKTLMKPVGGANFDTSYLVPERFQNAGERVVAPSEIIDLTEFTDANGRLQWDAPDGDWRIYRFCYTIGRRAKVNTCSQGWEGLALDPMDAAAFQRYWDSAVEPLMKDAHKVGGDVLKYLHTDSWEIEPFNWTANMPKAFQQRCGYDLLPWLPVLGGHVLGSREASERFLHDFRKTVGALVAENYYGTFLKNAHRHGMQVRAESGGPHGVPIDAQHCLGMIDVPMSEFWANSWSHRVSEQQRFFVKQPASAAHTYGKKLVAAEGFTTIGPQWQERVWDNLKPNFDHALCEGLNQLVWTLNACSPPEMGMPGQDMFAGTHFNPNSTWWRQSEGFLAYINRCHGMLRQGLFVADVLYYYGDHVPNFAGFSASNPAKLPAGYDYDVASEHVLLQRASVKDGRIVLPDGMSYTALVLPPQRTISLPVLRKLNELATAGAVLVGSRPDSSSGLKAWQEGDAEARTLIDRLWGSQDLAAQVKFSDTAAWLKATQLPPDFDSEGTAAGRLDYIHRRDRKTDIYFVDNPSGKPVQTNVRFRVQGRIPEFWDPRNGTIRTLPEWRSTDDGRIELPLAFEPYGSGFVVFRDDAPTGKVEKRSTGRNFPEMKPLCEIAGPWELAFDPAWFYPDNRSAGRMVFDKLTDWTKHPDAAVRHFSGAAVYRTSFDLPATQEAGPGAAYISLGKVREMARVTLNGRDLGVAWCPPWQVPVPAGLLAAKDNHLSIEVVNFWPNRLIGDTKLPRGQRRTRTNITKFERPKGDKHYTTLMPSGLLGPVTLQMLNLSD